MTEETREIHLLETQLEQAKVQEQIAIQAWSKAGRHDLQVTDQLNEAFQARVIIERALASAKSEPYAVTFSFPIQWDRGAPLPILLVNDYRTLLTFLVSESVSELDETEMIDIEAEESESEYIYPLALVEFKGCLTAKLGSPNDEVFHGHYLEGRGIEPYSAQIVRNSPWLKEIEQVNSVHHFYKPERWKTLNHYIFWFHDSTFECIARDYTISLHPESYPDMLARMSKRLLET